MAATAHSDPYGVFLRKIGYSVGLDRTLERFGDLQGVYLETGDVTLAKWSELVGPDTGWQLKTDNIADVFYSLGFIHRTPGDVLILENLDAAAIAAKMLDSKSEVEAARSFNFLWALLVNDGEIFVNLMLADFEEDRIRDKLEALIKYKRDVLSRVMTGRDAAKRVAQVVTIERQDKNKGSAGTGKSIASLKRTEPLQSGNRSDPSSSIEEAYGISNDYLKKVSETRRRWARSLGFWNDKAGLTGLGQRFKETLRSKGYITPESIFVFWPMDYELIRSGFKANLIDDSRTLWETLIDVAEAYDGLRVKPFEASDADALVDQLESMMQVYRSLHTRKSMLRRELAITIAYPAIVAIACAKSDGVIDVPKVIDTERKADKRRIAFRRSRNTGGGLSVKR